MDLRRRKRAGVQDVRFDLGLMTTTWARSAAVPADWAPEDGSNNDALLLEDGSGHYALDDGSGIILLETASDVVSSWARAGAPPAGWAPQDGSSDGFLLEDGSGHYMLDDGSGVILLESSSDTSNSWTRISSIPGSWT
jgi:hypothetical protein